MDMLHRIKRAGLLALIFCLSAPLAIAADDMAATTLQQSASDAASGGSSLLGSLLAGSAIGALFGYPSTGLGIIDLALACVGIFVMFRLILHFGLNQNEDDDSQDEREDEGEDGEKKRLPSVKEQANSAWDRFRSLPLEDAGDEEQRATAGAIHRSAKVPKGFDTEDFLEGAKLFYTRLQTAWAARDLGEMTHFLTPEMLAVLQEQGEKHPQPSYIAVLLVTPTLLEVTRTEEEERAKVLFKALLSEGQGDDSQTFDVREIWFFVQDIANGGSWHLDGIEQVVADGPQD